MNEQSVVLRHKAKAALKAEAERLGISEEELAVRMLKDELRKRFVPKITRASIHSIRQKRNGTDDQK
jgi:hypothetical protein